MTQLTGLLWFVFMLAPLILLQRLLHREIQAVFLILTRTQAAYAEMILGASPEEWTIFERQLFATG